MAQTVKPGENLFMRCYFERYMVAEENQTDFDSLEKTLTGMTQVYEVLGEYIKVMATSLGVLFNQNVLLKGAQNFGNKNRIYIDKPGVSSKGKFAQERGELEWVIDKNPQKRNDFSEIEVFEVDKEEDSEKEKNNKNLASGIQKMEIIKSQVLSHVEEMKKNIQQEEINIKKAIQSDFSEKKSGEKIENTLQKSPELPEKMIEEFQENQKMISGMEAQSDGIDDDENANECEIISIPTAVRKNKRPNSQPSLNKSAEKPIWSVQPPPKAQVIQITQQRSKAPPPPPNYSTLSFLPNQNVIQITQTTPMVKANSKFQLPKKSEKKKTQFEEIQEISIQAKQKLSSLGLRNSSELQVDASSLENAFSFNFENIQESINQNHQNYQLQFNPAAILSQPLTSMSLASGQNKPTQSKANFSEPNDVSAIILESDPVSMHLNHSNENEGGILSQNQPAKSGRQSQDTKNWGVNMEVKAIENEGGSEKEPSGNSQTIMEKKSWKKEFKKQDKKANLSDEKFQVLSEKWPKAKSGPILATNIFLNQVFGSKPESPVQNRNEDPRFTLEIPQNIDKMPELPPSDHM